MVTKQPNKVYVIADDEIHRVTEHQKGGLKSNGRRWWTDRVYSQSTSAYVVIFADNADELPEAFTHYRIRSVWCESGFKRDNTGFRVDYQINCRIEPVDIVKEPPENPVEDDELPTDSTSFVYEDEEE